MPWSIIRSTNIVRPTSRGFDMTRDKEPRLNKYLPTIKIANYGYSIRRGDPPGTRHTHLTVEEYALHEYLIWRAYHWYDMHFPMRVPGFKLVEKLARKMGGEHRLAWDDPEPRLRDRLVAWTVNQDIRCYHLGAHKAKCLLVKDLTEEEYQAIRSPLMKKLDDEQDKRRAARLEKMVNSDDTRGCESS